MKEKIYISGKITGEPEHEVKRFILVACERSGRVRDYFEDMGWNAWSCDLFPTESEQTKKSGKHFQCDIFKMLENNSDIQIDLLIAFPPCTFLTCTGNRWFINNPARWQQRIDAMNFVYKLMNMNIKHIAIENPVGAISSWIRKPDCIIHPYQFGDAYSKKTCLWLKNLPALKPTKIVEPIYKEYHSKKNKSGKSKYSPLWYGYKTGYERSITPEGIAKAMATQWTEFIKNNKS
jgi:hypothetical protein